MNAMITVPKTTCATVIPFPLERRRSQVKIEAMIELLIDLLPTAERRSRAKIEARIVYLIDLLDAADAADADLEPDEDGEASDDVGTDDAPEWRPWMSARRISRRSSRSHY